MEPCGAATGIGSLPHRDPEEALELVLRCCPEVPFWPQLPRRSPREGMLEQFLEGLPLEAEDPAAAGFMEEYLQLAEGRLPLPAEPRWAISPRAAPGLHLLAQRLRERGRRPRAVKGQLTGPFTLLSSLGDGSAWRDPGRREVVLAGLGLKAAWQAHFLRDLAEVTLIFLDEPALGGMGSSAFIGLDAAELAALMDPVLRGVHAQGALAGLHVCANTDWGALLGLEIEVLSFDAYRFADRLLLYREEAVGFLRRGGVLAWGLVPSSEEVLGESARRLAHRWRELADPLCERLGWSPAQLLRRSLITPSCGLGSLSPELAERALQLCAELAARLREEVGSA